MKKNIFILLLISISITGFSQTKISGVITYYFNEYQGNKADIGASVILIDSSKVIDFDYKLYEKFYYGEFYQELYFGAMRRYAKYSSAFNKTSKRKKFVKDREIFKKGMEDAEKDMESHKKEMEKYGYDTPENIANNGAKLYLQLLKLNEDLPKKTVDSNGNYSMNIEPGVYYVYIKSKNRTSIAVPGLDGKIYIKKVNVPENFDKDVSYNFEL